MYSRSQMKDRIQRSLRKRGYNIHRMTEDERERWSRREARLASQSLDTVFGPELKRLADLRNRYAEVQLPVATHSVWQSRSDSLMQTEIGWGGVDLRNFRGQSAYVWDYGAAGFEATDLKLYIFARHVLDKDQFGLLGTLIEDGDFGCSTFEYAGVGLVSRDLLDSILEISFLGRHLGLFERNDLRVLDIGAGYGRMAHRLLTAHPQLETYACADAVPESTFLSEFYLRHRALEHRAEVVPLDELDLRLQPDAGFNLAINIHSFSECTYEAIEWWLRRIKYVGVRHLMIVPNESTQFLSVETDGSRRSYAPLLQELGYELIAQEPVFDDAQVRSLIGVEDCMFLFEGRG